MILGVAVNFMRLWAFISGSNGNRTKIARIADSDAHLSFDERIAERMRELGNDAEAASPPSVDRPAAASPPKGFGRRGQ